MRVVSWCACACVCGPELAHAAWRSVVEVERRGKKKRKTGNNRRIEKRQSEVRDTTKTAFYDRRSADLRREENQSASRWRSCVSVSANTDLQKG